MAGFDRLRERTNGLLNKAVLWILLSLLALIILIPLGMLGYGAYVDIANGGEATSRVLGTVLGVAIIAIVLGALRSAFEAPERSPSKKPAIHVHVDAHIQSPTHTIPSTSRIIWLESHLEHLYESMFNDRRPPEDPTFLQTLPAPLLNEWNDELGLPISALEASIRTLVSETKTRIGLLDVPIRNLKVEYSSGVGLPNNEPAHIEFGEWNSILRVDSSYRDEPFSMCSILCHELAHFVMDQNSLRKVNRAENEQLTDLFVFACGQGRISLGGIYFDKEEGRGKLGYLSIEEMAWAFVRTAFHRGMDRDAILSACIDRRTQQAVKPVLEFLTIKDGRSLKLSEVHICPSKHILRFDPKRRVIKCPKCGWHSEIWNRREDERSHLVETGRAALAAKDYNNALQFFRRAQTLMPRHSLSYCLAAECLAKLGQRQNAIREVRKILTLLPHDELAHEAMKSLLYN